MTAETERWLRREGVIVLVVTCAIIVFVSTALSASTFVRQSNADTVRKADRKAASISAVSRCYQSVETAPQLLQVLGLLDTLATNPILANEQALRSSQPDDPLRATRLASLERIRPARAALRTFILNTTRTAPTAASCRKLAESLGVDPTRQRGATP